VIEQLLRAVRVAVAEHIEADDPVPALGERLGQLPVHEPREKQAGHEHDEPVTAPVPVVDQPVSVEVEAADPDAHELPPYLRGGIASRIPAASSERRRGLWERPCA
jgi:hypothetical protein